MKILVGFNGGDVGMRALELARDYALLTRAFVHIITSLEGGPDEKISDIQNVEKGLKIASNVMEEAGVPFLAQQSVRGMSPGEDLVRYAHENDIDHIFLGIKKKSRTQKMIMGSTARYIILKAHCPVTTIK